MAQQIERKRLVLVEDNAWTRQGVAGFAETYDWATTAYGDYQSAIEGIEGASFAADLLLTDFDLGGERLIENGFKIAKAARLRHPIIPIALYSTDELLIDYELTELSQFGINLFISKNNRADALGAMFEVAEELSQTLRRDRDPSSILAAIQGKVGIWVAVNEQGKLG